MGGGRSSIVTSDAGKVAHKFIDLPIGTFLLTRVSFDSEHNAPYLRLMNEAGEFLYARPGGQCTLEFNTHHKRCIGWYDMRAGNCHSCPAEREVDDKYEQCPECQQKTGFNPAFYNTTELSQQQAELNAKPHILYLAYFAPHVIKVGITYAARNLARLLEQGARSAVILETFPSANIARQYEAQIARLPGMCESVQLRKKINLLTEQRYDQTTARQSLEQAVQEITMRLNVSFEDCKYLELSRYMLDEPEFDSTTLSEISEPKISGEFVGMIGSLIIMRYGDRPVFLPLKKFSGRAVIISREPVPLELAPLQTSLF